MGAREGHISLSYPTNDVFVEGQMGLAVLAAVDPVPVEVRVVRETHRDVAASLLLAILLLLLLLRRRRREFDMHPGRRALVFAVRSRLEMDPDDEAVGWTGTDRSHSCECGGTVRCSRESDGKVGFQSIRFEGVSVGVGGGGLLGYCRRSLSFS